jgi:peptidoglycan/xylan/chitin deacetylase (PgdA/CDA1 family)
MSLTFAVSATGQPVTRTAATPWKPPAVHTITAAHPSYLYSVKTKERVAFITIDDGWARDDKFLAYERKNHVPVTAFLLDKVVAPKNLWYWQELHTAGVVFENHSMTHLDFTKLSDKAISWQICQTSKDYKKWFGYVPQLLRPPYGAHNNHVVQVAHQCGIKAVVGWDASIQQNGPLTTWHGGENINPGDIILMHFHPNMENQVQHIVDVAKARHIKIAYLESYL